MIKTLLKKYCECIQIDISEEQLQQFQLYFDLLIEKNKVMNLTAITEKKEVVLKHFIDSIYIIKYMDINDKKIMDVGTGAGFPGIPMAIMCPKGKFVLLDSLNKRISFLKEVCDVCNIENVQLLHSRAEDGARDEKLRENFDVVVSRAVANMSTLLEYTTPFCCVGGKFISYKTGHSDEEIEAAMHAAKQLGCEWSDTINFVLPETDIERRFVIYNKIKKVAKKYPRQAGKPKREPL